jgi:DNA-binding HxlR family transcriptional regulator
MPGQTSIPELIDHRYRPETGGCPIEAAFDLLGGRWKGLLLWRICSGPKRFHELRRALPHISQRMLVRQLRELERDGLIVRSVAAAVPSRVDYSATESALVLRPVMNQLRDWAAAHLGIALSTKSHAISAQSGPSRNVAPKRDERKLQAPRRTGTHDR